MATILLIEDNPITRQKLRSALESEKYHVLEADSGKQAIQLMEKNAPELILQDLLLPDIKPIELNKKLRSFPQGRDIPIIALSGFFNKIQEIRAIHSGFTSYLIKPIEISRLLEVIKRYLSLSKQKTKRLSRGEHVLVVDDDPVQLKLMMLHLKHMGFQVSSAFDGEDALKKAMDTKPDAIISDILMPRLDGFELCLRIRKNTQLKNIPVILISSQYLDKRDQDLVKKVGANAFINRIHEFKSIIKVLDSAFKTKAPVIAASMDEKFNEQHTISLTRQLEKQVNTTTELKERSALRTAQLSLLQTVADELSKNKPDKSIVLENVLAIALDAAGISKGILYLKNNNDDYISLHKYIGFMDQDREELEDFFGEFHLLTQALTSQEFVIFHGPKTHDSSASNLLSKAKVKEGMIIPLCSENEDIGVLFLGADIPNVFDMDFVLFANSLGKEITQTILLASTFERLAISEQRHRTLMDKACCGILICDHKGIIIEVNKEVEKLLGCPKEYITGNSYQDFIHHADVKFSSLLHQKLLREKSIGPNEGHIKQANGNTRDVEYSVSTIEVGNEILLLAFINDITERNKFRSQAQLSDKLVMLGTLATGIVHEINNPLTWVMENLHFIKESTATLSTSLNLLKEAIKNENSPRDSSHIDEYINDMQQKLEKFSDIVADSIGGAEQIRDITGNLKGFARIDDESSALLDIHDVVNAAIKLAWHGIKHNVRLEKDYATDIPKSLLQHGKLQQVFLNLIMNASQAMTDKNIENNIIRIRTCLENNLIRIDVSDTGCGIAPEHKARIFEPFFTTKPVGVGTGLGLPICHEIINSLGGLLQVQSTLGLGTIFTIFLPLRLEEKMVKKAERLPHVPSRRILIVDDEPSLLKTMQRILEPHHQVTMAIGGRAAIDILSKRAFYFDVIITDIKMPDISGADLYRFIADKQPGLEKHIIFITGGLAARESEKFLKSTRNAFIEKPFTKEELLQVVDEVMRVTSELFSH